MINKIYKYFTVSIIIIWILYTITARFLVNIFPGYGYLFLYIFAPVMLFLFIISVVNGIIKKNYKKLTETIVFFIVTSVFAIIYTVIFIYLFSK